MTDLDISSGGVISVDPEVLREVAARIGVLAATFDTARDAIMRAYSTIVDTPGFTEQVNTVELWASGSRLGEMNQECQYAVHATHVMADVFEYVELSAQARAITDSAAAEALQRRMDQLTASDPRIQTMAEALVAGEHRDRLFGLVGQYTLGGLMTPLYVGSALVGAGGLGKIPKGATLTGKADPVTVMPVKTSSPESAPGGFEDAFERMPTAEGAQIKVEKYTFADGTTAFVAYMLGSQTVTSGGSEPWDSKSNVELYTGKMSASYQATLDALAAAGAKPGDEVNVVGHSQSGMIAAYLAMQSEYDVQVQITAGSPVEPTLDADQTLIQFAHDDDVVRGLAGVGSPGSTGSPDSFTVSREGDPIDGVEDTWLDTHWMHSYTETARQADHSGDPRVEEMDKLWERLGSAVEIEATEFHAERT